MRHFILGLIPAILSLSTPVSAQGIEFTNSAVTRAVSGTLGVLQQIESGGDGGLLAFVMWGERSDAPCHIVTRATDMESGSSDSELFADCHRNSNKRFSTTNSRRSVRYNVQGYVVTGVQACMNLGNNRIKGIKLIGERLECVLGEDDTYYVMGSATSHFSQGGSDHTVRSDPAPRLVQCGTPQARKSRGSAQANCNDRWRDEAMCSDSEVVTGLAISTRDGSSGRTVIQGIAPVCRRITRP